MISILVRVVYVILALMIPGGFIFMGLAWAGRRVFGRFQLKRPPHLPLKNIDGALLYSVADWERDQRAAHPARYLLTVTIPKASRRAVAALKRPFRRLPPSEQVLGASFDVLVRYVGTKEGAWVLQTPPPGVDDDPIEAERWTRGAELRALYEWWTTERYRARIAIDAVEDFWDHISAQSDFLERDQLMLNRLVNAREVMH